ncbi:hypothetical protein [Shimazuella kribbensis]|uniref:hypothetical protein n=1 Tax=Shimazuella kribbensis TaxID=139808 RepID=UPI00048AF2E5|nr:hypothetical protein [Shimazuella kribbensis]
MILKLVAGLFAVTAVAMHLYKKKHPDWMYITNWVQKGYDFPRKVLIPGAASTSFVCLFFSFFS